MTFVAIVLGPTREAMDGLVARMSHQADLRLMGDEVWITALGPFLGVPKELHGFKTRIEVRANARDTWLSLMERSHRGATVFLAVDGFATGLDTKERCQQFTPDPTGTNLEEGLHAAFKAALDDLERQFTMGRIEGDTILREEDL